MSDPRNRPRHAKPRPNFARRRAVVATGAVVIVGGIFAAFAIPSHSSEAASTTTTKPTPAPRSTTTTVPAANVSMSFVGDMDLGSTPTLAPNPVAYLAPMKATLSAPTVFGNLEGTLTNRGFSKCGGANTATCYAFRNPPGFASVYRATGFTVLNSANNHSHDFGSVGQADTTAAIKGAGMFQAGLPGQIGYVTQHGVRIAFCAFAPYSNSNNLLDPAAAAQLIRTARAHAQIVVVYMHAGAEGASATHVTGASEYFYGEDRGNPEAFAKAAINAGASLVVASGPHVVRGMQFYKGHLIAYSLGNFVGYQNFATSGTLALTGVLRVSLHGNGTFAGARFLSATVTSAGQPFLDVNQNAMHYIASLSHQDFGTSAARFEANGTILQPLG